MKFKSVSYIIDDDQEILSESALEIALPESNGDDEVKHMLLGEGVNTFGEVSKQAAFNCAWIAAKALINKLQDAQDAEDPDYEVVED